jgi:hypothetical protein
MAPKDTDTFRSSPEGESSFVTAHEGEGEDEPPTGGAVPVRLFGDIPPEPLEPGYMAAGPADLVEPLVLHHVREAADEVGDTDSAASADACNELSGAMEMAFWDRVQFLIKNEDDTEDCVQPDVFKHEKGQDL